MPYHGHPKPNILRIVDGYDHELQDILLIYYSIGPIEKHRHLCLCQLSQDPTYQEEQVRFECMIDRRYLVRHGLIPQELYSRVQMPQIKELFVRQLSHPDFVVVLSNPYYHRLHYCHDR